MKRGGGLPTHPAEAIDLLNRMKTALDIEYEISKRIFDSKRRGSEYKLINGHRFGPNIYEFTIRLLGKRPPTPEARVSVGTKRFNTGFGP